MEDEMHPGIRKPRRIGEDDGGGFQLVRDGLIGRQIVDVRLVIHEKDLTFLRVMGVEEPYFKLCFDDGTELQLGLRNILLHGGDSVDIPVVRPPVGELDPDTPDG
jgi:hypothetical protein